MQLPDISDYGWPDLDDRGRFPASEVRHTMGEEVTTALSSPIPALVKPCYPDPGRLDAVVPFAFPTNPLDHVLPARLGVKPILPVIPSLGVHCPTLQSDIEIQVGDVGTFTRSISTRSGDSCLPVINDAITFPCTSIKAQVEAMAGEFREIVAEFGGTSNRRTGAQCIQDLLLQIGGPGCTDVLTSAVVEMTTSGDATFARSVGRRVGGCGLALQDHLTIPCITPTVVPGSVKVTSGSTAGGVMRVIEQGNPCDRTFKLDLDLSAPCVTPTIIPGSVAVQEVTDPTIDGPVGGSMQVTQSGPPCDRVFQIDVLVRIPSASSGSGAGGTPGVEVINPDQAAAPQFRDEPCTNVVYPPDSWGLTIRDNYGVIAGKATAGAIYGPPAYAFWNATGRILTAGDQVDVRALTPGKGGLTASRENTFGDPTLRDNLSALDSSLNSFVSAADVRGMIA